MSRTLQRFVIALSALLFLLPACSQATPSFVVSASSMKSDAPTALAAADPGFGFNKFGLRHPVLGTVVAAPTPAIYDTRWGTDSPATIVANGGWWTFAHHSGAEVVWVDSGAIGNDTHDCLTAATACATWDHAFSIFKADYVAGTQPILMVAGTAGRTYTDSGANSLQNMSGISLAYPALLQSYDPADPTNAAKYGKLLGTDLPSVRVTSASANGWSNQFGTTDSYYVAQGIEFDGLDVDTQNFAHIPFNGSHEGVAFQNCRFKTIELILNATTTTLYTGVSKSAFYGPWAASGNASCLFIEATAGLILEDSELIHCGWRNGGNRFDSSANGSPNVFGHGDYYADNGNNAIFARIVYVSSAADGLNIRGQAAAYQITTIDEPIAANLGGFSNNDSERPGGVTNTVDDWFVIGGTDLAYGSPRSGIAFSNTLSGSHINNVVVADQPNTGVDFGISNNAYLRGNHLDPQNAELPIDIYMAATNLRGYNWGTSAVETTSGNAAQIHTTINNSILDLSASAFGTGNSVANGTTYPGALNRAALWGALGFTADKTLGLAQLTNYMIDRPDLPWSQWIISKGLPAYGLTPIYATVASINLTGITPPVVYGTSVGVLSLSDTTFTHGTAKTVNIVGIPAGWGAWSTNLPSGCTISSVPRTLTCDGTEVAGTPSVTLNAGLFTIEAARSDTSSLTISGGGGTNLLVGKSDPPGSGVTSSGGATYAATDVFSFPANTNVLVTFAATLQPNTSYTLSYDYTISAGNSLKYQDGAADLLGTTLLTTDGVSHHVSISFTTPSTTTSGDLLEIAASGALYGPGSVSNLSLTSP